MEENKNNKYLTNVKSYDTSWKEDFQLQIENEEVEDFFFELSIRIMERLEELGWKKSKLAEELGVSKQYVSKLLRANENLGVNTIYKISKVLGIRLIQIPEQKPKEKAIVTIKLQSQSVDYNIGQYFKGEINYSIQKQFNTKWQEAEKLQFQSRC
jgi:transcriptional regulator with XRE-family HTH domain